MDLHPTVRTSCEVLTAREHKSLRGEVMAFGLKSKGTDLMGRSDTHKVKGRFEALRVEQRRS